MGSIWRMAAAVCLWAGCFWPEHSCHLYAQASGPAAGDSGSIKSVYIQTISDKEPEPDYVSTGPTGVVLFWQQSQGAQATRPGQVAWRCRVLSPTLQTLYTADLPLEPDLSLILSEEEPDGGAVWLLFQHPERRRQVLCLRLAYATSETETYRLRLPVDLVPDQLRVASDGLYLRGAYGYNTIVLYLDLDRRQASILPYGPDQRRMLLGSGTEPATGRFYAFSTRRGRGAGQVYLQTYERGQAIGGMRNFRLREGLVPTLIYSIGSRAGERELALYAPVGTDKSQGLVPLRQLAPQAYTRFADSLSYFTFAGPKAAGRLHARYATSKARPEGRLIQNTYIWHAPTPLAAGGYLFSAERYTARSRPYSPIQPGLYAGFDPLSHPTDMKEYETSFLMQIWLDTALVPRRLESIGTPSLIHYDQQAQVASVPSMPPLITQKGALLYFGSKQGQVQIDWYPVPPERIHLPLGDSYEVSHVLQEGPVVYAWGKGTPRNGTAPFWWIVR